MDFSGKGSSKAAKSSSANFHIDCLCSSTLLAFLMVWGCMTAQGIGYACRIDGNMNAELYTRILEDEFLQSLEYYEMEVDKVIFQQDNDPKHTSHAAQKWFKDNGVEVLDWPAQSPDLNPIEHLWQYLKQWLATYETDPVGMHELWERVEAEWNKIPQ